MRRDTLDQCRPGPGLDAILAKSNPGWPVNRFEHDARKIREGLDRMIKDLSHQKNMKHMVRNDEIFSAFCLGERQASLARRYHLTPERIRQIIGTRSYTMY